MALPLAVLLLASAASAAVAPVRIGASLVDPAAPGAPRLLEAMSRTPPLAVLGAFKPRRAEVLNSFAQGLDGVTIHLQALPQQFDPENIGGYTFKMAADGSYEFKGSGSVFAEITPAVERAILRHLGVRPAEETRAQRLRRGVLRALDSVAAFAKGPDRYY